ncbi:hypothetical protein AB1Y20_016566 [Prymnesium parvum]|uniref:endopeptidase La n=1 Tax=Prymnesium parvum TaxID=97485 RepID=A0AB34ICR3_PRYPA
MVRAPLAALLLSLAAPALAGRLISRIRPPRAPLAPPAALPYASALLALASSPHSLSSLRRLVGALEAAEALPGGGALAVRIDELDPPTLRCLEAAGFDRFHAGERGGVFLLRREGAPPVEPLLQLARRELAAETSRRAALERPPPEADDSPPPPREEEQLLSEISKMVAALVQELERVAGAQNRSAPLPAGEEGTPPTSGVPIHFRVYRSPMGGVGGGGMPLLPGGLGGGLGGEADEEGEVHLLERRLRSASLPREVDEVAQRELKRLRRMSPMNSEYSTIVDYLEWIADLPWNHSSDEILSIQEAREKLEADHFGLDKVKTRILEYLAVCKLKGDMRGSILCLLGPPGIGKTSLGRSVADALHRDFYRVSLGGVHSEAEVRGHRRTYVGALPGLIIQAIKKCGTNNCVVMLDEIDKLGRNSFNGDPSSALLEVLDPEQNQAFRDHFLNVPFNLSRIMFIATANDIDSIPRPLRDRMEIIEMSGYTAEEKVQIARRHLTPKQLGFHGLPAAALSLSDETLAYLISAYTREAGVRDLDRLLAALCRSLAARAAEPPPHAPPPPLPHAFDPPALHATLGPPRYEPLDDIPSRLCRAGVSVGLAYTPAGGDVLFVEAEAMAGSGALLLTGQLGDVMQESARAAASWIKAHAAPLGLPPHPLNATDVHLHFPAGAMPKDGPSAGVAIAAALVSRLTGRRVRQDVAMTGELTLGGAVLPVGGVKEKVIAAHRAALRHVILPARNEKDLAELPPAVLEDVSFTLVSRVEEALQAALLPAEAAAAAHEAWRGAPRHAAPFAERASTRAGSE